MGLWNRGPHSHYGGQKEPVNDNLAKYAELAAYIRETLNTALARIDASIAGVVDKVLTSVKGELSRFEAKVLRLSGDVAEIVTELEDKRSEIIGSSVDQIRAQLDDVVEELEDSSKQELNTAFSQIREEYVSDVKEEVVAGALADMEDYLAGAKVELEQGVERVETTIADAKNYALLDIAEAEQGAVTAFNNSASNKKSEVVSDIDGAKNLAVADVQAAKNAAIEEIEENVDSILEGAAIKGHLLQAGLTWDTGNTIRIYDWAGDGSGTTYKLEGKCLNGLARSMMGTEVTQVYPSIGSTSKIVDWRAYNLNGESYSDVTFDGNAFTIPLNGANSREYFIEILYYTA